MLSRCEETLPMQAPKNHRLPRRRFLQGRVRSTPTNWDIGDSGKKMMGRKIINAQLQHGALEGVLDMLMPARVPAFPCNQRRAASRRWDDAHCGQAFCPPVDPWIIAMGHALKYTRGPQQWLCRGASKFVRSRRNRRHSCPRRS